MCVRGGARSAKHLLPAVLIASLSFVLNHPWFGFFFLFFFRFIATFSSSTMETFTIFFFFSICRSLRVFHLWYFFSCLPPKIKRPANLLLPIEKKKKFYPNSLTFDKQPTPLQLEVPPCPPHSKAHLLLLCPLVLFMASGGMLFLPLAMILCPFSNQPNFSSAPTQRAEPKSENA